MRIKMPSRRSELLVAEFLRDALAVDALGAPELEARARAAGLLSEHQRITHPKVFKSAKKFLERSLNQTEWAQRDERAVRPPLCLRRVTIQVPRQKPLKAKLGARFRDISHISSALTLAGCAHGEGVGGAAFGAEQ
jgi:hypothetical protein